MTVEEFGDPILFASRMFRIVDRATRATELYRWGLHPQSVDENSSLALDDSNFMTAMGGRAVERSALWPTMSATDNLAAAGKIFIDSLPSRHLHASSLMSLCRAALESSARTIWLLCDPDRDVRRKRFIGIALAEMKQQTLYHSREVDYMASNQENADSASVNLFKEGHKNLIAEYEGLKKVEHETVRPFGTTVELAARWIDEHLPEHDTGELSSSNMAIGVKRVYSISSGVIHGYQWVTDYTYDGNLFGMLADTFAAAVNMTECAIALFESQAQGPAGMRAHQRHYPERLHPTITTWSRLYR